MKEKLAALWGKVVENKHIIIPVTTAVVGGLIGAAITNAIINNGLQSYETDLYLTESEALANGDNPPIV